MHCAQRFMLHCSVVAALLSSGSAWADDVIGLPMRVGVLGGYQLTSGDFDVLGIRRSALQPGDGGLFGLRVGWRVLPVLEVELSVGLVPAGTPTPKASALLLPAHVDLVIRPFAWRVRPYASVGGGVMALVAGDAGRDADGLFHAAIGVEAIVGDSIALRAEVGLFGTDAVQGAIAFSPTFVFGVDILAWRPRHDDEVLVEPWREPTPPVPTDKPVPSDGDVDRDGVANADDRCPQSPGSAADHGCPDTDRDGLIDPWDRCPTAPGPAGNGGCPDKDGDGISDHDDACPDAAGPADRYGCPVSSRR